MVKFKGVSINIVSQLDVQRLPEFSKAQAFDALGRLVACYVPVCSGSQFWFEYAIDGPHAPQAAYLFRLFMNGEHITNWDCTAKHSYYGKAAYSLQHAGKDEFRLPAYRQQSFQFRANSGRRSPGANEDCVEIRIHKIEHRQRIRNPSFAFPPMKTGASVLRLQDSGFLAPGRPARFYQYQLLNAIDEPYAIFRFYCRSYEYLERHNILGLERSSSSSASSTSTNEYCETIEDTIPLTAQSPSRKSTSSACLKTCSNAVEKGRYRVSLQNRISISRSETSLSTITKDSIEDLRSTVPRSPESGRMKLRKLELQHRGQEDKSTSPTRTSKVLQKHTRKSATDVFRLPPSPEISGHNRESPENQTLRSNQFKLSTTNGRFQFGPSSENDLEVCSNGTRMSSTQNNVQDGLITRTRRLNKSIIGLLAKRSTSK